MITPTFSFSVCVHTPYNPLVLAHALGSAVLCTICVCANALTVNANANAEGGSFDDVRGEEANHQIIATTNPQPAPSITAQPKKNQMNQHDKQIREPLALRHVNS